ncbi:hypothetical protein SUGI_0970100 [Cryptomeria japonica]|nr:hypothetical protein SUGI_0970100 [Cryptomeria japonica]
MRPSRHREEAALYDRIENLVDTHQLPDDFQCNEELIRKGTQYRLYVEPLDIANYYRFGKHEDSGPYLLKGRPRRYKALQKWLEDKKMEDNSSQPKITKDSCFWAYVEEISCLMNDPKRIARECKDPV